MTTNDGTPPASGSEGTANPADLLPARTTPTWEIEILLSGASAFALFQAYDAVQKGLGDLVERVSPETAGLITALGTYLMAGVMALALGFIAHLTVRAFWAAAIGLHSIDPTGALTRTGTLGPVQRALVAGRWARMPQRIAELDDWATIVFAVSLGLAKMMIGLIVGFIAVYALGSAVSALSNGTIDVFVAIMAAFVILLAPFLIATTVDGQYGKKNRPSPPWVAKIIAPYAAAGMTPEHNLGLQMMVHRVSSGQRSWKGVVLTSLITFVLLIVVMVFPVIERVGIGTLLRGEFPALLPGHPSAVRSVHYLDRLPEGEVLRSPLIPSDVVRTPYLRLFVPYVPYWHDAILGRCIAPHEARDAAAGEDAKADWRLEPARNADVLACVANAMPITLDGAPVTTPWVFVDERDDDRRGFLIMIDVRALPPGRHELAIRQPDDAMREGEPVVPWRIPFWR